MKWYDSIEDFKKEYDVAEEVSEEELETYSGTHKDYGVAYTLNLIIEFKVALAYSPEKCRNAWHVVYKTKIRENTVERIGDYFIYLKDSAAYIRADSVMVLRKRTYDDEFIGGRVALSNGKELEISCCEYYDLKDYLTGELECLK